MNEILTSDYAKEFTDKIYTGELVADDITMLYESGYLKDTKLYSELIVYCRERKEVEIAKLSLCATKMPYTFVDVLIKYLNDADIFKFRKEVEEEIYGEN